MNYKNLLLLGYVAFFLTNLLRANPLDLSGVPRSQWREHLRPYLNALVEDQSLGTSCLSISSQPHTVIGIKYQPLIYVKHSISSSSPTYWLATNLGSSLQVGGFLQLGDWLDNTYGAMGLTILYKFGQSGAQFFSCQLTHVKGFEDFHFRTLSLGLARQWQGPRLYSSLGYYCHFLNCQFHNTTGQKAYRFDELQAHVGLILKSSWRLGIQTNLGRYSQTAGIACFYYL